MLKIILTLKGINGMLDKFKDKIIGVDTSPFIYFIEEHQKYLEFITKFFQANHDKKFSIVTSTVTLLEVLVLPYKNSMYDLANEYEQILCKSNEIELISIEPEIAKYSAKLRAQYNIRTPDAIQIATSISSKADYFLTNDKRLKTIKEIDVLLLSDLTKN